MEEPGPELKAAGDKRVSSPDFDALVAPCALVRADSTLADFFDVVLGLDGPGTVGEVADRAGHGVDAARESLAKFERMGVVTQGSESPAMYERNQAYLNWQRVQQLQEEYDTDDLRNFLAAEREREKFYAASFDVASPDAVSIPMAASTIDRSIEDVWEAVSAWRTSRRRIQLLERALQPD